jgi:hypothetical protein
MNKMAEKKFDLARISQGQMQTFSIKILNLVSAVSQ